MKLPQYELYETGSQIRRASKSVTTNIVEGYGRSRYKNEFVKFLTHSQAFCDETILHLNFIKDIHWPEDDEIKVMINSYSELGKKIFTFIQFVETSWK